MKNRTRSALAGLALVALGAVLVVAWGTWSYYRRALQVRTFADMQTIARKLDAAVRAGSRSRPELLPLVRSVNQGRDAWGADFILELRAGSPVLDYVLISTGSDGRLDLPTTAAYFSLAETDVRRQYRRDIVFRNGLPVTRAGK